MTYQPKPRPRDPDGELLLSRRERAAELAELGSREGLDPFEALAEIAGRLDAVRELKDRRYGLTLSDDELDQVVEPIACARTRNRMRRETP